jgi:molybdate transport system ATP-binding protein
MTLSADLELARGAFRLAARLGAPGGAVTVVTGRSGAGKTTLLRAIAGLERGARGLLEVDGSRWQDGAHFEPPHRRALGYVFQEPRLFSHLSVRGNLWFGWRRVAPALRRIAFDDVVASLELGALLDRRPGDLSGGEQQRVAIGRALLTSPRLLLLDEPVSSLDRAGREEVLAALDRAIRGLDITTLYVTHSGDEVARMADHVAWMEAGRVVAAGPVSEMLTRLDLPLAHGPEAEAVVSAEVSGRDEAFSLNRLRFAGGELQVAGRALAAGRAVRLRLLARDVSLALEPPAGATSILNIFPVEVVEMAAEDEGQSIVRLDAGGAPLLARITRRSATALELAPGRRLYAQVKSVALLDPPPRPSD